MYKEAFELIQKSNNIVLLSHINPDADALGSSLGLFNILKSMNKNISIINYTKELARNLDFLPNFKKIKHELPSKIDLIISCDSGNIDRLGFEISEIDILNIDHHKSNTNFGVINLVEPTFPSTTSVVYKLLIDNEIEISQECATCLYTGLADDTGFFKYESTTANTFEIANKLVEFGANPHYIAKMMTERVSLAQLRLTSLILNTLELTLEGKVAKVIMTQDMLKQSGAKLSDTDEIVTMVRALASVEVSIFLREDPEGVKVSLRSKNFVDVSEIAVSLGGGGHKRAAGINYKHRDFELVYKEILEKLKKVI